MPVESNPCFGCGLGVESETGLLAVRPDTNRGLSCTDGELGVDAGCGIGFDGSGNVVWTRRSLAFGQYFVGFNTVAANTPAEVLVNGGNISLTNTSCGPMVPTFKVNVVSPGMLAVTNNNWLLRWYVSVNGTPFSSIGQARLNHAAGGTLGIDWPPFEWSVTNDTAPIAPGGTATLAFNASFQTPTFTANAGNLLQVPGFVLNISMRPDGV